MNNIVRSSVQKVGLLTRNVAAPVSSVRTATLKATRGFSEIEFYGSVTLVCVAYAVYGLNRCRKNEERIKKYADKM